MTPAADPAPDVTCVRCGYDLRGIDDRRACPECGLLAGFSRRDEDGRLGRNAPAWIMRLLVGAIVAAAGSLAMLAWPIGLAAVDGWSPPGTAGLIPPHWAGLMVLVAPTVLLAVAAWMLGTPSGRPAEQQRHATWRWILRCFPVLPGAATLLVLVVMDWTGLGLRDTTFIYASVVLFLGALAAGLLLIFLKDLAARVPAPLLKGDSPIVGYALTGCAGAFVVYLTVMWLLPPTYLSDIDPAFYLLPAIVIVSVLITAWLWTIYLFVRYAWAFGVALRQARGLMATEVMSDE